VFHNWYERFAYIGLFGGVPIVMSMATASILKKIIGTELAGGLHAKGVSTLEHGNDKRYLLPKHRVDLIEEGLYLF